MKRSSFWYSKNKKVQYFPTQKEEEEENVVTV